MRNFFKKRLLSSFPYVEPSLILIYADCSFESKIRSYSYSGCKLIVIVIMTSLKRVVVGLSGGVDSAVAALLLKKRGFNVVGAFMRNWDLVDEIGSCSVDEDRKYAREVSQCLGIEFHEVDFVKEFWHSVFTELTEDYQNGFTPNPDILCNKHIKFKYFFDYALKHLGGIAIATGHYARSSFGSFLENYSQECSAKLLKAKDATKDQTFFLSQIPQKALQNVMFPVGELSKSEVKKLAIDNGLGKIASKKESMGICFIGLRKFQDFICDYIKPSKGHFIDIDSGSIVGEHEGKHYWTLGQRCRIGGLRHAYYVASKTQTQDIYVAKGHNHSALFSETLITSKPFWINIEPPTLSCGNVLDCSFRFQHRKPLISCKVFKVDREQLWVRLSSPLRALTPGQYAVFYNHDECLGSARISHVVGPSYY